ncbi:MAG TPA: RNA 2',3'-cyclic phosphodiesterase [Bacillota bacterium]|nr:RNA 2',3'-cyclic phosphodiesterase [Bacillota bacterium]
MRTFISINLPEEVREEIKKIQDKLPRFQGKLTELDNLHLTLKFLGEVDSQRLKEIKKKLKGIKFEKFETEIDSLGVFSEKFIRIVWLHMKNCDRLQKEVDEKLEGMFEKETRFMSHLTIARVKFVKDKKKFLEELKSMKVPKISFKVIEFCLMKSELTKKGPKYSVLEVYKLN